jgi:SAM-dependent methyltransferase
MQRQSFFGSDTTELIQYKWPVAGIGECRIGFGFCIKTGIILQTTTVTPDTMLEFYENTATYVNPNHSGKPMPVKVLAVKRWINTINNCLGFIPESVLEIGSGDGYTLSCFREAGSKSVLGIEPSHLSRDYAKSEYDIMSISETVEEFKTNSLFDLMILTHVIEHIYDPLSMLKNLNRNLKDSGHLLIEVPLWESLESQPMGVLTFEHLNYFSELTLQNLLNLAGFESVFIEKVYDVNHYPIICVVAKKNQDVALNDKFCSESKTLLDLYIKKERNFWSDVKEKILTKVNLEMPTYIYGSGIHTSQLLGNTNIKDQINLKGFFDTSESKQGKALLDLIILKPELELLEPGTNVIISSFASEKFIYEFILSIRNDLNIINIYN